MLVTVINSRSDVTPPFDGQQISLTVIPPAQTFHDLTVDYFANDFVPLLVPTIANPNANPITTILAFVDVQLLTQAAPYADPDGFPVGMTIQILDGLGVPTLLNPNTFPAGLSIVSINIQTLIFASPYADADTFPGLTVIFPPVGGPLRVTQSYVDVISGSAPVLRITQAYVDVISGAAVSNRVSQIYVDVVSKFPPDPPITVIEEPDPTDAPSVVQQAWNPADHSTGFDTSRYAIDQLVSITPSGGVVKGARAHNPLYGKRTWSFLINVAANADCVGIGQLSASLSTALGSGADDIAFFKDGTVKRNGVTIQTYTGWTAGSLRNASEVNVAFDADTGKIWFGTGGVFNGSPAAGTGAAATMAGEHGGAGPFKYYYPMAQVIDQSDGNTTSFTGQPRTFGGPSIVWSPTAAPSGFAYFDAFG